MVIQIVREINGLAIFDRLHQNEGCTQVVDSKIGNRSYDNAPGTRHPPRTRLPPGADTRCGRYASYWNAFLYFILISNCIVLGCVPSAAGVCSGGVWSQGVPGTRGWYPSMH